MHKRLLGEDLVLWHNGDKVLAWQDFCPHRGARLSLGWVEKDTLVCPYHVESQQPRRLPLDLQAEVHLPSDRYSLAYRKWLKQQGVVFGTI